MGNKESCNTNHEGSEAGVVYRVAFYIHVKEGDDDDFTPGHLDLPGHVLPVHVCMRVQGRHDLSAGAIQLAPVHCSG